MKRIDLDIWEPDPEHPGTIRRIGQRTAQEVFAELKYRLEQTGYLPDEYFLLDIDWEDGREIPEDADIFCTADYGGNEGIYLDVYLKWYEDDKPITKSFATGKTLGETESDLDRMHLTASAVMKAFRTAGTHSRYIQFGQGEAARESVLHLNPYERRLLVDSLIESRNNLIEQAGDIDAILLRVTGGVIQYVNEVGTRPLRISDYDKAVMSIHDGDLHAFKDTCLDLKDNMGGLLVHAAGRPGSVGSKMTALILSDAEDIPGDEYLQACKNAVELSDKDRTLLLLEHAEHCVREPDTNLYGEVIKHAYSEGKAKLAGDIINKCSGNEIASADPYIMVQAAQKGSYTDTMALVEKGVDANRYAADVIRALNYNRNDWIVQHLLDKGMKIDGGNFPALQACIDAGNVDAAKCLLEQGMDFEKYNKWSESSGRLTSDFEALAEVEEHWTQLSRAADNVELKM